MRTGWLILLDLQREAQNTVAVCHSHGTAAPRVALMRVETPWATERRRGGLPRYGAPPSAAIAASHCSRSWCAKGCHGSMSGSVRRSSKARLIRVPLIAGE
jgi:hypothetical protein